MKNCFLRKVLIAATAIVMFQTLTLSSTAVQAQTIGEEKGYFCNPPLPYLPYKLDVLFIGNSFAIDTSTALPSILNSLKLSTVSVYVLYKGACSMKQHYEYYKNNEPVYELYQYDIHGEKKLSSKITIREAMRKFSYDVVVFQQYSLESGNYSSYEPYLSKLLQLYKITTTSPRTTFAFNQTWAYSSKHKDLASHYGTQDEMYKKICEASNEMKLKSGIDIVIPCGTAVQNARHLKSIVTKNEWTRDNQHISLYQGRYLLACTFFESIIAPCLNANLREDETVYGKGDEIVNQTNRRAIQNCAMLAVADNYEVSEFINDATVLTQDQEETVKEVKTEKQLKAEQQAAAKKAKEEAKSKAAEEKKTTTAKTTTATKKATTTTNKTVKTVKVAKTKTK